MCHQFFNDIKLGTGFQMYIIFTNRRIDSFDLSSIQRKYRIFTKINFGNRIEYTGSGAFTLSVMLFYIAYICIFFHMESMNTIMAAFVTSAVVDTTSGNDSYICTFCYIKIIVNNVRHSACVNNNRNMNFFAVCFSIDENIDSRLVLFFLDFNMLTVTVAERDPIMS